MRTFLVLLPAVAVVAVLVFKRRPVVRLAGGVAVVLTGFAVSGGLIAPHRIAEELVHRSPQSGQWHQGARDTRGAVYGVLAPLALVLAALVVLALVPPRLEIVKAEPGAAPNGGPTMQVGKAWASEGASSGS